MQVATRPVADAEKSRLWQAYEQAMRAHIETIWGWDEVWQRADFDKAFAGSSTQVVEVDGEFAGYVQLDCGAELYLRMLILLPAYQSRGIGARVLEQLLALSQARMRHVSARVSHEWQGQAVLSAGRLVRRRRRGELRVDETRCVPSGRPKEPPVGPAARISHSAVAADFCCTPFKPATPSDRNKVKGTAFPIAW